jgi:hypothetical protein
VRPWWFRRKSVGLGWRGTVSPPVKIRYRIDWKCYWGSGDSGGPVRYGRSKRSKSGMIRRSRCGTSFFRCDTVIVKAPLCRRNSSKAFCPASDWASLLMVKSLSPSRRIFLQGSKSGQWCRTWFSDLQFRGSCRSNELRSQADQLNPPLYNSSSRLQLF